MKEVIKHLRIAVAMIFLGIGHALDARDIHDMKAELHRIDPDYEKAVDSQDIARLT